MFDEGSTHNRFMGTTDDGLDATSRKLLNEIDELKKLELEKRHTARGSEEFHVLASKVETARGTSSTRRNRRPTRATRKAPSRMSGTSTPGDWTEGSRN